MQTPRAIQKSQDEAMLFSLGPNQSYEPMSVLAQ